ncbi:MAG: DUF1674 domain-containing protein [Alphaproteobacteria bacterium]
MAGRGQETGDERRAEAGHAAPDPTTKPDAVGRDSGAGAGRPPETVEEIGGPKGPEPTRYGDWEKGGRCSDF